MTKLNDAQLILLSTAAQRDDGSLYLPPETLAVDRAAKAISGLVKRGFAEERDTSDPACVHRSDGDLRFGMFITDAGSRAIGVESDAGSGVTSSADMVAPTATPQPGRTSKRAAVVALLQRDVGATLPELIAATGWLPHTTRAALTGLRKKGHAIERSKRDDATCYRIPAVA